MEWVAEDDWQPVGQHVGDLGAVDRLQCSYCRYLAGCSGTSASCTQVAINGRAPSRGVPRMYVLSACNQAALVDAGSKGMKRGQASPHPRQDQHFSDADDTTASSPSPKTRSTATSSAAEPARPAWQAMLHHLAADAIGWSGVLDSAADA